MSNQLAAPATLRDDPYMSAPQEDTRPHSSVLEKGSLGNSIDGSGPWIGVHLLDAKGNFVQGGWFLV